jgi:hypothetical protein
MAAFKDSQKGGAGAYTSNTMVGRETRTGDPATDPKAKPKDLTKPKDMAQPRSIATDLDVKDGCSVPIVGSTGGYKPVTGGGGRRYEPL